MAAGTSRATITYLSDGESDALMNGLASFKFSMYRCDSLSLPSTFSSPEGLKLRRMNTYSFLTDLLHFDGRWLKEQTNIRETPAVEALLGGIRENLDFSPMINSFHSEKLAFLEIAKLLQCFCNNVTLSAMTYNESDLEEQGLSDKFEVAHLGMGVMETWRGTPDSRMRGFSICTDVPFITGYEQLGVGSNGTSTVFEAKIEIKKKFFPQLVKTAVVTAFIENNLHPELNTMVPTILIDTTCAVIALYCTKHDLLFISDKFSWRNDDQFNVSGVTFLWAMINHRYFLRMIEGTIEPSEKSGIQRLLQEHLALEHFKQLVSKDRFFKQGRDDSSDDSDDGLSVVFNTQPPPKKTRIDATNTQPPPKKTCIDATNTQPPPKKTRIDATNT